MRIDRRLRTEHRLSTRQHFFCECWFNLVHEASLDAFRVRAMNPLNIVRELLRLMSLEHTNDSDLGRVVAEVVEIFEQRGIVSGPPFDPAASRLLDILKKAEPKSQPNSDGMAKAWGVALASRRPLIDAFGRELVHALQEHFVPRSLAWLKTTLREQDGEILAQDLKLPEIERVTDALLSALISRGWSLESLFMLYRMILRPNFSQSSASQPSYDFAACLGTVFERLSAAPKPYRITFAVSNVSKPEQFPAVVGGIAFSATGPRLGPQSSSYVQRYAQQRGGRLFATVTVEAQDGRIAGAEAADRIGQVLDVVRYDYERKNVSLAINFLVEKDDRHMLLQLPGTVPNPDSSLTAEQLERFMGRLQDLVGSGTLSVDAKDRIYSAFRLYRIGADTSNFENKLVNWWTAVEFLVKGSNGATGGIGAGVEQSLAPTVTLSYLPKHLSALQSALVDMNAELRDSAGQLVELKGKGLAEFYHLLQEPQFRAAIEARCEARPFIWYRARKFLDVVTNDAELSKTLENHERRMRWHIQRIYRARCDIVHSAHRVVDATLLCANLEFYLKTVLTSFLEALHRHPTLRSPREFFDRQEHALREITSDLKSRKRETLVAMLTNRDAISASTA